MVDGGDHPHNLAHESDLTDPGQALEALGLRSRYILEPAQL